MKKHHILTLALILIASVGFGQYNLNYPDIKIGNSATGKIVLNGSNLQMPRIGLGSVTDSVLTIVNGVVKKVPRSQFENDLSFSNGLHVKGTNKVQLGLDLTTISTTQNGLLTSDLFLYRGNPLNGNNKSLEITEDYISFSKQYNSNIQSLQFNSFSNVMQIIDAVNNKGLEYNGDYSVGRTFPADNNWIPNAKYVNDAVSGAVSGNYIATNNGTGNNTTLNTPSITNGSANNLTIGLTSPTTGRFTNLTATTTATVPTVATSDNSTNAASTAHVKANLSTGQTIGANTTGKSNTTLGLLTIDETEQVKAQTVSPGRDSQIFLYNTNNVPVSITGSAASATLWGNATADFTTAGVDLYDFVGRNSAGTIKPYSTNQFKSALATSLQDVTNVNPGTTNTIQIKKNQGGVGIDITNETDATFKMGVTGAGASNMYGWVGSDVPNQKLILNPDNGGFVGVRKTAADAALDVNGSVRASSNDGNSNTLVRNIDLTNSLSQTVPVSVTSQAMTANRVYIPHSASLTTFTLPTTATEGQLFQIVGEGSGGWRVSQNASQQIVGVNVATTSGTTGYVQSTNANCTITIRCTVANSKFTITSSQGTLTIN